MIRSMTGFGRKETADEKARFTVELKSVNHRYLDINIKMPRKLNEFEAPIRRLIKEYVQRGKLDLYISYESEGGDGGAVHYNPVLAEAYLGYLRQMAEQFGLKDDISVSRLSRYPDVFTMDDPETNEEELWNGLETALRGALDQFVASREQEGIQLQRDLEGKLDEMLGLVEGIREREPEILEEYRQRIEDKVRELLADRQLDEGRILQETALFADRICVDEETVRLCSHIQAMKDALEQGGGIGRKLDFIAQEMNREANTILSKSVDLKTSQTGIELKTGIEKVREQVQNIE